MDEDLTKFLKRTKERIKQSIEHNENIGMVGQVKELLFGKQSTTQPQIQETASSDNTNWESLYNNAMLEIKEMRRDYQTEFRRLNNELIQLESENKKLKARLDAEI
ncbi:hypothetical protein [Weissella confusa]